MKKALNFCLVLASAVMLTGCGEKFNPTESTLFVNSKGNVRSASIESFEQSYYDFEELTADVNAAVEAYCSVQGEGKVVVESLTETEDMVSLEMKYESVADYADFNDVILFHGTYADAVAAGYQPEELFDTEGNAVNITLEENGNLNVVVTEESICVQTKGKIQYVSNNVTVIDQKLAKALEAGETHLAFVLYK